MLPKRFGTPVVVCETSGDIGSVLGLVGPASVICVMGETVRSSNSLSCDSTSACLRIPVAYKQ